MATTAVPVTGVPIGVPAVPPFDAGDPPAKAGPSNEAIDPARLRVFIAFLPLLALAQALAFLWVTTLPIYAAGALGLPIPLWGLLFGLNGLLIVVFQMRVSGRSRAAPSRA